MRGNRFVRGQLTVFAALALVAVLVVSLSYLQVPRMLGWGQMHVTAELPMTGGLGPNGRVTYRGLEVGKVEKVSLTPQGVRAELSLREDAELPADVQAQVHSASVIGEQYLELLPTAGTLEVKPRPDAGPLAEGAVIPATTVEPVPVDAGTLLGTLDSLITSVDSKNLRTTVDELNLAFEGSEEPLARLLDGSNALVGDAQANLEATKRLIGNLGPVLATQRDLGPQIRALAANAESVTGQLRLSDNDLRVLIGQTPAVADQIIATVKDVHPALPTILANLGATGEVLSVYLPGIKQILSIYPAIVANLQASSIFVSEPGRANMNFHVNINDPAPCRKGFTGVHRSPKELGPTARLDNGWCKLPADADTNVRGARNQPCPSGRRSATAAGCGYDFTGKPVTTLTAYDPATGRFRGPDGRMYTIDLKARNRPGVSPYTSGVLRAAQAKG